MPAAVPLLMAQLKGNDPRQKALNSLWAVIKLNSYVYTADLQALYNQVSKELNLAEEFETLKPEGLAKDVLSDEYMMVFDQGTEDAYFLLKAL